MNLRDCIRSAWGWAVIILLLFSGLIAAVLCLSGYYLTA